MSIQPFLSKKQNIMPVKCWSWRKANQ
ncbi:hypothetical protein CGLO_09319 [Colletotrichum gloeosporioides Cg-14]|uniref:Uncharacterized protein n=1 Tax=Colletotrichum gloeosporioides (strain Cg-14) TaxID=1237896 RepID=T0LSF3_COLGC|nr:hypothetical protein CGLO_09319 [Colletotrichum gloeosporioides Cg-14]